MTRITLLDPSPVAFLVVLPLACLVTLSEPAFAEGSSQGPQLSLAQARYYGFERELGFSAEGDLLVTVGSGGITKIWHVASGRILRDFDSVAVAARFDPQGQRIAIGTSNGTIEIRSIATGDPLLRIATSEKVETLDWSPDGQILASASQNRNLIEFWGADSGRPTGNLPSLESPVRIVRYRPGGILLAAVHKKGVDLWDLASKRRVVMLNPPGEVTKLAWSADGSKIATGDRLGQVRIWDVSSFRQIAAIDVPAEVGGLSFRNQDLQLLIGSGMELSEYTLAAPERIRRHKIDGSNSDVNRFIRDLALAPDSRTVAVYGGFAGLQLFDLESDETRSVLTRIANSIEAVAWSPTGRFLATGGAGGKIRVRDLTTGELTHLIVAGERDVRDLVFTAGDELLLSSGDDGYVSMWPLDRSGPDVTELKTSQFSKASSGEILSIALTPDGRKVAWGRYSLQSDWITVQEIGTDKPVQRHAAPRRAIQAIAYTPEGTLLGADSYGRIEAWTADGETRILRQPEAHSLGLITVLAPSHDGRHFAHPNLDVNTPDSAYVIEIRSTNDGKISKALRGHRGDVKAIAWSKDGRTLATGSRDFTVRLWDAEGGSELRTLHGHRAPVTDLAWSPDGRWLASVSRDGTTRLWDAGTGELRLSFLELDQNNSIVFTPDNFYTATLPALDSISITLGRESYSIDQFDLLLNRPDKVLSHLPNADPELVRILHEVFLKRLSHLGLENEPTFEKGVPLPEFAVLNEARLPAVTAECSVQLETRSAGPGAPLARIDVWVNDVPLFGKHGLKIDNPATEVVRSIRINLSGGVNQIRASVSDHAGFESRPWNQRIECNRPASSRWHVVAIGVSHYRDQSMNLQYAAKDARDLARHFADAVGTETEGVEVHLLTDINATRGNILRLQEALSRSTVDDKVLLFFAGHGVLTDELEYFLATTDTDFARVKESALSIRDFESLVNAIPARTRIVLIDACNSGELDPEAKPSSRVSASNVRLSKGPSARGVKRLLIGPQEFTFELMRQLFKDLRQSTGATVIASTSGYQAAFEDEAWQNGVFTYSVLTGIKSLQADFDTDGRILLSELQRFVAAEVPKLTDGSQRPTTRMSNFRLNPQIWPLEASNPELGRRRLVVQRANTLEIVAFAADESKRAFWVASEAITDFRFSPDGSLLAVADGQGFVHFLSWWNGESLRVDRVARSGVRLAIDGSGRMIATATDQSTQIWDVASGSKIRTIEKGGVVALSPDGRLLATADKDILLWSTTTGEVVRTLSGNGEAIRGLCITADGKTLVVGTANQTVPVPAAAGGGLMVTGHTSALRLWNIETGVETRQFPVDFVKELACSSEGTRFGAAELLHSIFVADASRGETARLFTRPKGFPQRYIAADISHDGRLLAAVTIEGEVDVWDLVTRKILTKVSSQGEKAISIRFYPRLSLEGDPISQAADRLQKPIASVQKASRPKASSRL